MRETRTALLTALVLLGLATALVALRRRGGGDDAPGPDDRVWSVTVQARYVPLGKACRVRMSLPSDTPHTRVLRETTAAPKQVMDVVRGPGGTRTLLVVPRRIGKQGTLEARFDIRLSPRGAALPVAADPLTPEQRLHNLQPESAIQVDGPEVTKLAGQLNLRGLPPGRAVDLVYEYCWQDIAVGGADAPTDAARTLQLGMGQPVGRARAMVALCRSAGVPARLVCGVVLRRQSNAPVHVWTEVYLGRRWVPFDPEFGWRDQLPPAVMPIRTGGSRLVRGTHLKSLTTHIDIARADPTDGQVSAVATWPAVFELTRLPLGMQEALAVLLLLPLGALITAVFRNIVGIQTYGTFTPALLGLSMTYGDWRTGMVVFAVTLVVGLVGRRLLESLRLLMVPRLSLVLTMVVLCLVMAVSVLDHLGLTPSARAVVFPLVITTMIIERMFIKREEDGMRRAATTLAGTLLVAGCCFAVLSLRPLGRLVLAHPESVLAVAAGLLLVGRYAGYRLSELVRFRDLAGGAP